MQPVHSNRPNVSLQIGNGAYGTQIVCTIHTTTVEFRSRSQQPHAHSHTHTTSATTTATVIFAWEIVLSISLAWKNVEENGPMAPFPSICLIFIGYGCCFFPFFCCHYCWRCRRCRQSCLGRMVQFFARSYFRSAYTVQRKKLYPTSYLSHW